MRRIWNITLVVIAVIVFAIAGYVLLHHDTPSTGTSAAAPVDLPTDSSTPAPPSSTGVSERRLVVAFLGDDWTSGVGASSPAKRFTTLVSQRLHVTERNFGADGSGYAMKTASSGAYASRIDAVVAARPDVVVVSGGRNDYRGDTVTAADRARTLFVQLHDRLPQARLIAVAPFWGDSDLPSKLDTLGAAVKSAVRAVGGTYLDIADPIHGHPSYMADAGDPDDQGYAALADALTPRLAPLLKP